MITARQGDFRISAAIFDDDGRNATEYARRLRGGMTGKIRLYTYRFGI